MSRKSRKQSRTITSRQPLSLPNLEALEERTLLSLIGVAPDFPLIDYNSTGQVSYAAAAQEFKVLHGTPDSFATLNLLMAGGPTQIGAPTSFNIDVQVDHAGNLIGGVPGDDMVLTGQVDTDGNGSFDATGTLLTGEVIGFGFQESGTTDLYDFLFQPTGGALAPLFAGQNIGVTVTSENSTFAGSFQGDFGGHAKGVIGTVPAPVALPSSVAGHVYSDNNNNGVFDAGDAGIPSVSVTLTGTDVNSQSVNVATTTGSGGVYSFAGLLAGAYTITETQPAGYLQGSNAVGTVNSVASGLLGPGTDVISQVALGSGQDGLNYDFGELPTYDLAVIKTGPATAFAGQTITYNYAVTNSGPAAVKPALSDNLTGTPVYVSGDNGDGLIQPGETWLYVSHYVVPGTSGGDTGGYGDSGQFSGCWSQYTTYCCPQPPPPPPCPTTITNTATVTLAAGQPTLGGDRDLSNNTDQWTVQVSQAKQGSVTGSVYEDDNNNGVKNSGEDGIYHVSLRLTGVDYLGNAVTRTTTTDCSGVYKFTNLLPGVYAVSETQPGGYFDGLDAKGGVVIAGSNQTDVIGGIVLGSGQTAANNNFGEVTSAKITGYVYADADKDGVKDYGEDGIGGVKVILTGVNDLGALVTLATTTNSCGAYSFTGLRPGTYSVTEAQQPTGYLDGLDSKGGVVIAGSKLTDVIKGIALKPGGNAQSNNFGELLQRTCQPPTYGCGSRDGYSWSDLFDDDVCGGYQSNWFDSVLDLFQSCGSQWLRC